jgi:hypothetical protein
MEKRSIVKIPSELCVRCRGSRYLCGLGYCPILVESFKRNIVSENILREEIKGSSPPTVFVGRIGYPNIMMYPSSPPLYGDTSYYERSDKWLELSLEEFLSLRLSLIRGGIKINVKKASDPDETLMKIHEMSISEKPVDIYMRLERPPRGGVLSEEIPPLGPWSPLKKIFIESNPKSNRYIEKVYYDHDLRSREAIIYLYSSGVDVNSISRVLSVGALGVRRNRKIVPTRWAITAVDSILSDHLLRSVKEMPVIDRFKVFIREIHRNLFIAILAPTKWMFEWGEAWFPGSTWNPWGSEAEIEIDYEGFSGRDDYPSIGGCYYASRLAVAERLYTWRRQASAILWREIYPGFNIPVGVWFVRENIRKMLSEKPFETDSIEEALDYVKNILRVPLERWLKRSYVARLLLGRRLDDYLKR